MQQHCRSWPCSVTLSCSVIASMCSRVMHRDDAVNNALHNPLIYRGQTGSPDLQVKGMQVPELAVKALLKPDKVGEAAGRNCSRAFGFVEGCKQVKTHQPQRWVVHVLLNSPTSFPCPESSTECVFRTTFLTCSQGWEKYPTAADSQQETWLVLVWAALGLQLQPGELPL